MALHGCTDVKSGQWLSKHKFFPGTIAFLAAREFGGPVEDRERRRCFLICQRCGMRNRIATAATSPGSGRPSQPETPEKHIILFNECCLAVCRD